MCGGEGLMVGRVASSREQIMYRHKEVMLRQGARSEDGEDRVRERGSEWWMNGWMDG